MGRRFNIHINPVNILQMPKHLCYSRFSYAILSFMLTAKQTKGFIMIGDGSYIVAAILFLTSGCVCLVINSYWGLSLANYVAQQTKTTLIIEWECLEAHQIISFYLQYKV
jgi:hypothetical protein